MQYYHVDVFSHLPLMGNGLTVVFPVSPISQDVMQSMTQEFKQFESIFITPAQNDDHFVARIFTVEEELQFAGHPVIGAAAVIHHHFFYEQAQKIIYLQLGERIISVHSQKHAQFYTAVMNQGKAQFINLVESSYRKPIAHSLNLQESELDETLPIEVVSTGLPYLLVPVKSSLAQAKINHANYHQFLAQFNAKFVYVFNSTTLECRTWDNQGLVEDVATGSAAGPLAAYLVKNKRASYNQPIRLQQGKYANRPSTIHAQVDKQTENITIEGDVSFFAKGDIFN